MPRPHTFRPHPKDGDTEERMVVALNSTDEALKEMVRKIEARPKQEKQETRLYTDGRWTDWKHTTA